MDHKPGQAETSIKKQIKADLERAGFLVRRVQSGKARVKRGWMVFAEKGTADLLVQGDGWMGWFEVKTSDGEQKDNQKAFQAEVEKRHGIYVIVRNSAEALLAASRFSLFAGELGHSRQLGSGAT